MGGWVGPYRLAIACPCGVKVSQARLRRRRVLVIVSVALEEDILFCLAWGVGWVGMG